MGVWHRLFVITAVCVAQAVSQAQIIDGTAKGAQKPEEPLRACELFNDPSTVPFVARVTAQEYTEIPSSTDSFRPPTRVDIFRVTILESFREKLPAEGVLYPPNPKRSSYSGYDSVPKFDPMLQVGSTYLVYATTHDRRSGRYQVKRITPAAGAPLDDVRRLSRMSTGTIEGDLHGFTVSESSPIFIGRVLERGYYGEGRKPTGQGIVTTKVEVARVKVLEAFSLTPSQEVWATAAQEDPDEPISGSSSELTVGETYFFRSAGEWDLLVDQKGPVRALITYHYLSQLVERGW